MDKDKITRQMDEVVNLFQEDIASIRTGRATPALIEGIVVTAYEGQAGMKLLELGSILVEGARSLIFQPWDKSVIGKVKNSIAASATGLNPVVDNDKIRIQLPTLTTEQREEYVRILNKKLEAARVMVRDIRGSNRHALQESQKGGSISEDDFHRLEKELQDLTDDYIKNLEEVSKKKEEEIRM